MNNKGVALGAIILLAFAVLGVAAISEGTITGMGGITEKFCREQCKADFETCGTPVSNEASSDGNNFCKAQPCSSSTLTPCPIARLGESACTAIGCYWCPPGTSGNSKQTADERKICEEQRKTCERTCDCSKQCDDTFTACKSAIKDCELQCGDMKTCESAKKSCKEACK